VPPSGAENAGRHSTSHWDEAYTGRDPSGLSWAQHDSAVSLELVDALGIGRAASVVDVGGGTSPLAGRLLDRGLADVTVLDVAEPALAAARERLGARAGCVAWLGEDVRTWQPARRFDLWHDRALFHFFAEEDDRRRYLDSLSRALAPGGAVVIATFAPDGPPTCSGLPVARYDAGGLASVLGPAFELVRERREEHVTPAGRVQPFTWVALRSTG
jgi:ubiquinone/menaquinone biosynthesis C-methylase UbiE